jgi:hypothetical protein
MIKSRRMRLVGHVACIGGIGNAYIILVRKPEGKRLLAGPKHRWEDNKTVDIKEVGWEGVAGFIWLRTGTSGEHSNETSGSIKGRESLDYLSIY